MQDIAGTCSRSFRCPGVTLHPGGNANLCNSVEETSMLSASPGRELQQEPPTVAQEVTPSLGSCRTSNFIYKSKAEASGDTDKVDILKISFWRGANNCPLFFFLQYNGLWLDIFQRLRRATCVSYKLLHTSSTST